MLRDALVEPDPFVFPLVVSGVMAALDPRTSLALDEPGPTDIPERPDPEVLIETLQEIDLAETTAALHVIAALTDDEDLAGRIRRTLQLRRHPVPRAVRDLPKIGVKRVVEMTEPFGDGDDLLLDLRGAGVTATFVVYVDHNLGTVVKDGFVVPAALDEMIADLRRQPGAAHLSFAEMDPAEARTKLSEAIGRGLTTYPPLENGDEDENGDETWPASRPLLEMLLRGLPEGGPGYPDPELDEQGAAELLSDFLASPFARDAAAGPAGAELAAVAELLVTFGTSYLGGRPHRWSPATVKILLDAWYPTNVVAPPEHLLAVPDVLRALIRFCHARQGIAPELTDDTLDAVDVLEPAYLAEMQDPDGIQHRGQLAHLYALLGDPRTIAREPLLRAVGGEAALEVLDGEPLPDEEVDWAAIPDDIHPRIREIAERVDPFALAEFGVEFRTACRRFLGRAAAADPSIFRRRSSADLAAAAIIWAIGKANLLVAVSGGMQTSELTSRLGVKGSPSQRAQTLLRVIGVDEQLAYSHIDLGMPDLLVSSRRAEIIQRRDALAQWPDDVPALWSADEPTP